MRCVACGRKISATPAATIASRGGPLHFGPVCARQRGLTARAAKRHASSNTTVRRASAHDDQLDLFAPEFA